MARKFLSSKEYVINQLTNKILEDYREDDEKERERQRAKAQSVSTSQSTNSSTAAQKSSQTAHTTSQGGSQGTSYSDKFYHAAGRKYTNKRRVETTTPGSSGRGKTTTANSRRTTTPRHRVDDEVKSDRPSLVVGGAAKQWAGGHLSGIGTGVQSDLITLNSYRDAALNSAVKEEEERRQNPGKRLSSTDKASFEGYDPNERFSTKTKDGADLNNVDRSKYYDLSAKDSDSETYKKIISGTRNMISTGDELIDKGTADIEQAKEGLGSFGQFVVDTGAQMTQWGMDAMFSAIPVVGQAISMGGFMNRAGGMAASQARKEGWNPDQQYMYQFGSALAEGISELTFQSVGALRATYGKGMFSLSDKLVNKMSTSGIVQRLLKSTPIGKSLAVRLAQLGGGALEEGLEEVQTDLVDPLLRYLIRKQTDPKAEFEGYDFKQMGYDFIMGATMGGLLGGASAVKGVKADLNIKNDDAFNEGYMTNLIKQASVQGRVNGAGKALTTNAELLAEQFQKQIDAGKEIQPAQIQMLEEALGQSRAENNSRLYEKNVIEYEKAKKSGELVQGYDTREGSEYDTRMEREGMNNATEQLANETAQKVVDILGEDASLADVNAITDVKIGTATSAEIDTVLSKAENKQALETLMNEGNTSPESAVSIPVNNAEARNVIEDIVAVNKMSNRNTLLKGVQQKNKETLKATVDNMNESGKELFASHAEEGASIIGDEDIYRDRFSRLYTDGNTKGADFDTSYERIIGQFDSDTLKTVFTKDFARQIFDEGRKAIITDTAKEAAKSKAEQYANRKAEVTYEKGSKKLVSSKEQEALQKFAERTGVEIKIVKTLSDKVKGDVLMSKDGKRKVINGMYDKGVITIAADSNNKLITVAKHELTHYIKETSPEMYQKLEDFVFERWYHGNAEEMEDEIARYMKLYAGQGLDRNGVREEILADASEAFFTDEGAIQDVVSYNKTLGRTIRDGIKTMLDAFLGLQDSDTKAFRYHGGFLKELDILREAERMWLDALQDSQERKMAAKGETVAEETAETEAKASLSDEDFVVKDGTARWTENRIDSLIREYGAEHDDRYSKAYAVLMNPRQFLKLTLSDESLAKWNESANTMPEKLKGRPYRENVENVHNERLETGKWIHDNENYPLDRNELAKQKQTPFLEISSSNGTMIDGHEGRHRMRALAEAGVESVPVVIRDTDTKYTKNYVQSMALKSQDFGRGAVNDGARVIVNGLIPIKQSNRDELIEKFGGEADVKFSISEDSDGNTLSKGQQEYFKDSKVRDKDGNLLKVYHGTGEEFYEFRRDQIGRHGSYEGAGFNFTPSEARATGYAYAEKVGRVMGGYLNITNPLSNEKVTFTANQLAKVIREIDPTGDDIIANYARDTRDYGQQSFIMRESLYTARQMLNFHDNDVDIYSDLSASGANPDAIISAFESMGYDGVIHYDHSGEIRTLIAFNSNQFKNADNLNPTENKDTRYSVSTDEEALPKKGEIPASLKKWAEDIGLDKLTKKDVKAPIVVSVRDLRSYWYEFNGRSEEAEIVNKVMDSVGKSLTKMIGKYKYIDLSDALNASVSYRTDENGKPLSVILSCQVKNAEYEVNFDLTTICAKRAPLQKVLERFIKTEGEHMDTLYDELQLDEEGLYKLRLIMEQAGFEVSCIGCFVEQNRYQQQIQSKNVADDWNKALDEWAKKNGTEITEAFDFQNLDINSLPYTEIQKGFERYDELLKGESHNVEAKNRALIEAIPYLRKRLNPSDYASVNGQRAMMAIGTGKTNLYNLLKRGQGDSKQSVPFTAYNGEISLLPDVMKKKSLFDYLMGIGGARAQSASDFQIEYVYDYMQMVADLSARGLPMHMYTKVIELAELFGMTGIKINLSAMCDVDNSINSEYAGLKLKPGRKGNKLSDYDYNISNQSIDFEKAKALQRKEGYSKNIGIIMVVLSKQHMLKSLDDDDVRYIIGYHSSKMPPVVSKASNMGNATDYTKINKTTTLNKRGRALFNEALKQAKGKTDLERYKDALRIFDDLIWNETQNLKPNKRPRRGNEYSKYLDGYKNNTADFDVYEDIKQTNDARATADNYIQYCMDNDLIPMYFPFAFHNNYYRCEVYDFNMYDRRTGEYAPMESVQNIYPGLDMTKGETDTKKLMARVSHIMSKQNEKNAEVAPMYDKVFNRAKSELAINVTGNDYMDMDGSGIPHNELEHRADVKEAKPSADGVGNESKLSLSANDQTYLDAVNRGDMKTAQRMVDEAAKRAGYDTSRKLYHGTRAKFNIFKSGYGQYGEGVYFTYSEDVAKDYARNTRDLSYGRVISVYTKPLNTADWEDLGRILGIDDVWDYFDHVDEIDPENDITNFDYHPENVGKLIEAGFDSFIDDGNDGVVIFPTGEGGISSMVKSADPVTYDDEGNVIPLSERFNEKNEDIRYSISEDSDGNKLTKAQDEYFKDSKVRDKNGNLLVMYHGTDQAGFNTFKVGAMFKGIFFSSSRRTADAYGGNADSKLYNPNERETKTKATVGNFGDTALQESLRDFHFDTKEDYEKFVADHPGIENVRSEYELQRMLDEEEITENEYDKLRKLLKDVQKDYGKYERDHMGVATWQDLIDNPDAYGFNDFVRAIYAYDREASIDEGYEPDTKESLLEAMKTILAEDEEVRGKDETPLSDLSFAARLPIGQEGEYVNKVNNRTYKTYVNLVNPLIVDAKGRNMNEGYYSYLEQGLKNNKYDGVIIKNVRIGKYNDEGYVVVAKEPNQVKLTSNENPTENDDIRYSISEDSETAPTTKEYKSTIKKLEEQVSDLKAEFKRTNLKTADPKQVRIQAGRFLKRHDANNSLHGEVVDAFNKIFGLYKEKGTNAFDEVYEIAQKTAVDVVNSISVIHDEGAEDYKAIKDYLKNTEIKVSDEMKRNITDYNDFRKHNFGRLKLVNGETSNIDNVYMELMEMFPGQFTEDYVNPADQLYHIVDVLDNYAPYYESLDGASKEMQDYVVEIASDLMETAYNLQAKKTFADKKYEEKVRAVKKAREEALASRKKALDRQKQRYEEKIEALKQHNKDYKAETRERAEKRRRIKQISNVYKRLLEKLQTSTDTKHLPDGYAPVVTKVLSMFDFTTGIMRWAGRHAEPSKRYKEMTNTMLELRKQLEQMSTKEGSELEVDPDLLDLVDEIMADMEDGQRLVDMDSKTLEDISVLFRAFEHQMNTYNKAFDENNKKATSETAHSIFNDLDKIGDGKGKWKLGVMGRLLTSNFNPSDFFELLGGDVADLYNATRKGFDKYVDRLDNAKTFLQDRVDNKKADKWANHVATYKTSSGEEIELTDTQLMSLYCLNKREQAQGHIYGGGIVSAPLKVKNMKKLIPKELEKKRVIPSIEDVGRWFNTLTDEQKEVANDIQRYFVDEVSAWGNETSMKLYNYKKFGEPNYFPIQSSSDYRASNFDQRGEDPVLKNIGASKATVKNANNVIVIDDIFTVFSKHVAQMASYNAYVPAITDFQRVWNYTEGNDQDMVKARFERVYGRKAADYIENFFKNLNGVYKANFDPTIFDKGLGLFKKAAVGGNIRVLVQQPTAIARSALLINPAYLTAAVPLATAHPKQAYRDMMEHCPIARWKTWGFYSSDITSASRDLKNIMIGKDALTDKIFMNMYGTADNVTWTVIFKACQLQVEAQNKGLEKGSDEYWEKVNDLASRVFDRTQVVDSPFHRSELMKSQDGLVKAATAFMAEPTKTINMLNTELTKAMTELKNGHPARAIGLFTRVAMVITANAAALAVAQAMVDAMRHAGGDDDKDKGDYEDRFKNYWKSNFTDNLNPFGMIPYIKDIKSLWDGYDVLRLDMNGVQKIIKSIQYVQKYYEDPAGSKYSAQEEWTNLALNVMYTVGVPISNAKRDIEGLYVSIMEGTGHPEVFFHQARRKYQLNDKTKGSFVDMYYDAVKGGNTALANEIHRYLIKGGITEKYIKQRKRTWEKHQEPTNE